MKTAKPVINALVVLSVEGDCIVVPCLDYTVFATLPQVVEFEGSHYGRTGWNSDRGHAYYKKYVNIAHPIK